MAENEEESEITAQFGNLLRVALGSGMQIREAQARRAQMQAAERTAEADRATRAEATVAAMVNREVYNPEFWRTAGSESIADRVTVAAHLAGAHAEARGAWMQAADVLRNDYRINLEAMNKDHPSSLVDRHAALRDALDDYFARQRLDAEADQALAPTTGQDQDIAADADRENTSLPDATAQTSEADRAASQKAEREADATAVDEDAHLALAGRYGAETQQDQKNAEAEQATGGRSPYRYERVTEAQLAQIERHANTPELADVRAQQADFFPRSTTERIATTPSKAAKKPASAAPAAGRGQETGVSR
ncbi:hypothetical protein [Citricoccus sp. I39-566]|uniref:hypothetical protein n=1 Tax=Citricoccus sp. I39-566 TaxID=3073268 RepID=UPI00286A35A7|nr:hypothetical protein [Citricoccus sp. I39-566]WMY80009.1 hypothetical protein RE421_16080 [Citricoccus sp. I39-566]